LASELLSRRGTTRAACISCLASY